MARTTILIQHASHFLERDRGRIEHCDADAPNGARQTVPVPEPAFLRQSEAAFGMALSDRRLAAQSVKNSCIVRSVSLGVGMSDRIGTLKRGGHSHGRHVDVA